MSSLSFLVTSQISSLVLLYEGKLLMTQMLFIELTPTTSPIPKACFNLTYNFLLQSLLFFVFNGLEKRYEEQVL